MNIAGEKPVSPQIGSGMIGDWIETDWKDRTATYTNLDAGEIPFQGKGQQSPWYME